MAAHLIVSLFFLSSLLLIPTHGRNLQKNYTEETSGSSQTLFSSIKVKTVSRAANSTGETNSNDVLGLNALTQSYPLLGMLQQTVDPCLPTKWSWIECNSDANPRVIALELSGQGLSGDLPDFSSMDALERIDLSNNILLGTIPSFLGTFPHLQELNLAYNFYSGLVPDSLACNKNLKLSVVGNTLLTSPTCSKSSGKSPSTPTPTTTTNNDVVVYYPETRSKKKSKTGLILGITVPLALVISIAFGIFAIFRHKANVAAAVATASAPGPNDAYNSPQPNTPMAGEERPINPRH